MAGKNVSLAPDEAGSSVTINVSQTAGAPAPAARTGRVTIETNEAGRLFPWLQHPKSCDVTIETNEAGRGAG